MRKALNESPIVQIAALAGLGVLVAVVFMMSMGGGGGGAESETATETPDASVSAAETASPAAVPDASSSAEAAPVSAGAATPVSAGAATGSAPFEAGKGLPSDVVKAHESGDVVVLYLMQEKGVEDELVKTHVELLRSRDDTTVFVTDVKNVSKYSRIAEGVSLNRVPAIIVLKPLEGKVAKGESAALPAATVAYGFRGNSSVIQTVRDALYQGKQRGYDPG